MWRWLIVSSVWTLILSDPGVAAGQCVSQPEQLVVPYGLEGEHFGRSLSIWADRAVIGGEFGPAGGAYALVHNAGAWSIEQMLVPADGAWFTGFGANCAIAGDVVVVSASNQAPAGAAYVFRHQGGSWIEEQQLLPGEVDTGFSFGASIAVGEDVILIGAPLDSPQGDQSGAVFVFRREGAVWGQPTKLTPSDGQAQAQFGHAVALGEDTLVVGARLTDQLLGSAYVFRFEGSTWQQEQKLAPADLGSADSFGTSVAVHDNMILVGSPGDDDAANNAGSVYAFVHSGDTWVQQQKFTPSNPVSGSGFGQYASMSGNRALIGTEGINFSAAYSYQFDGAAWVQHAYFGSAAVVAISGDSALIGAPFSDVVATNAGAAYVRDLDTDAPVISGPPGSKSVLTGGSVAFTTWACSQTALTYQWRKDGVPLQNNARVDGVTAQTLTVSGVEPEDSGHYDVVITNTNASAISSAAVLSVNPCAEHVSKLLATDGAANDQFGHSVAASGNLAVVGSPFDDSKGAAYVLHYDGTHWRSNRNSSRRMGNPATSSASPSPFRMG